MVRDLTISSLHPRHTKSEFAPPFQRIPGWERKFWMFFMVTGWVALPCFVLYNLPNYRGGLGPHKLMLKQQAKEAAKQE